MIVRVHVATLIFDKLCKKITLLLSWRVRKGFIPFSLASKELVVVSVWKGKVGRQNCNSYSSITVLHCLMHNARSGGAYPE